MCFGELRKIVVHKNDIRTVHRSRAARKSHCDSEVGTGKNGRVVYSVAYICDDVGFLIFAFISFSIAANLSCGII